MVNFLIKFRRERFPVAIQEGGSGKKHCNGIGALLLFILYLCYWNIFQFLYEEHEGAQRKSVKSFRGFAIQDSFPSCL
jgi:hypothetical protein